MKTLYICDLDGTLLNSSGVVSNRSVSILNRLIRNGLLFTVCTGRSVSFCKDILRELDIRLPAAVMNGTVIYDLYHDQCTDLRYLNSDAVMSVRTLASLYHAECCWFIYDEQRKTERILLENEASPLIRDYFQNSGETISAGVPFDMIREKKPTYVMCFSEDFSQLHQLKKSLQNYPVKTDLYHDVYRDDMWILDVFDQSVSKEYCVRYFRESLKPDRIVSFGDSNNDIGLFQSSDYSCCTDNGDLEAKEAADIVIGSNDSDSVAEYLLKDRKNDPQY